MLARALDSFIGAISPEKELKRVQARTRLAIVKDFHARSYEAASFSKKTLGWYAPKTSAIVDTKLALNQLRDRSRELIRNAPIARRIIEVLTNGIIGSGIVPQIYCEDESKKKRIEEHLKRFIDDCSFESNLDFFGIQSLCVRSMLESGEILVKFVRTTDRKNPLKLQILESDFIDYYKEGNVEDGGFIIQGVEYTKPEGQLEFGGKPLAYWLYRDHPGGRMFTGMIGGSFRVPASDIVHCFRHERPSQVRGIPVLTPVMLKIRDLETYQFSELSRKKLSSCYAGFIRDINEQIDPTSSKDDDYPEVIEPGSLIKLPNGKEITFSNPPESPNYSEYVRACLREIAAGVSISFESLSNDYSQVNFSSSRMGWLESHRSLQSYQWNTVIPGLIQPIIKEFLKMLQIIGVDTTGVSVGFSVPRREMIDPVSEIKSMSEGVKTGIFSLSECIRSLGYEPREVLQELSRDKQLVDSLGLKLDCFNDKEVMNATESNPASDQKKISSSAA
jgi:lambda family phage portal protein